MRKAILLLLISLFLSVSCTRSNRYFKIEGYAQGGSYHVTYSDLKSDGSSIDTAPETVKHIIDSVLLEIDNSLSGYNPHSTLSRINDNSSDTSDALLSDIFAISYRLYEQSGGYFDPSAAPLFDIWGFGFKEGQDVSPAKIDSIKQFTGMDKITIADGKIKKSDKRVKLNFNAIAQGYSCDLVGASLEKIGISEYLVEVGMEILCRGVNQNGKPWNIGIDAPLDGNMEAGARLQDVLMITDAGIVTSGNYRKFYIKDGKKYSHTINPLTGYPVAHNLLSATVIAPDAATADAYATYCMVIGEKKAREFLESHPDLKGYLIYGEQDSMKVYFTPGLKDLIRK